MVAVPPVLTRTVNAAQSRLRATLATLRRRSAAVDHLARAGGRYQGREGSRLAAVITLPGFLSFFPLVALALSVAGFVSHADRHAQRQVSTQLSRIFPGLVGPGVHQLNPDAIAAARTSAGVIGLVGLLLGGLGWIDALRVGVRRMWLEPDGGYNLVTQRIADVGVLAGLGVVMVASIGVTAASTTASHQVLRLLGTADTAAVRLLVVLVGIAVAVAVDVLLFGFLFSRLPQSRPPWRHVARGALFAAVGFEALKVVGALYLKRTTHNPLYGTFAVVIGLLIWTNLLARFGLLAAAWTATESPSPSAGTATEPDGEAGAAHARDALPRPVSTAVPDPRQPAAAAPPPVGPATTAAGVATVAAGWALLAVGAFGASALVARAGRDVARSWPRG